MSFEAMAWAVKQECGAPEAKLVLLMLAAHADALKWQCSPSIKTLARQCEICPETVRTQLMALEGRGLVQVVPQYAPDGHVKPNYALNIFGGRP